MNCIYCHFSFGRRVRPLHSLTQHDPAACPILSPSTCSCKLPTIHLVPINSLHPRPQTCRNNDTITFNASPSTSPTLQPENPEPAHHPGNIHTICILATLITSFIQCPSSSCCHHDPHIGQPVDFSHSMLSFMRCRSLWIQCSLLFYSIPSTLSPTFTSSAAPQRASLLPTRLHLYHPSQPHPVFLLKTVKPKKHVQFRNAPFISSSSAPPHPPPVPPPTPSSPPPPPPPPPHPRVSALPPPP